MDGIFNEWSQFLFGQSPKLLRQLDGIIDDELKAPGIAYGNFYTRVQRDPEYIDRRMHRDVFGTISEVGLGRRNYNNDNMFEFLVMTNLQGDYTFSVNCYEFLEPLAMEEDTNQLQSLYESYSYMPVNEGLAADVRKVVWNWLQDSIRIKMSKDRTRLLKEELVAAVWHPRRVQNFLDTYGWNALDAPGSA
jgi:hypothetical protein